MAAAGSRPARPVDAGTVGVVPRPVADLGFQGQAEGAPDDNPQHGTANVAATDAGAEGTC